MIEVSCRTAFLTHTPAPIYSLYRLKSINLLKQQTRHAASVKPRTISDNANVRLNSTPTISGFLARVSNWLGAVNASLAAYYRLCGTAGCMPALSRSTPVCLQRDEIIRVTRESGIHHIEVHQGTIWLTATPATHDVLLRPGDHFNLDASHPYILQAMDESEISLTE
jgi:hypothetical protein